MSNTAIIGAGVVATGRGICGLPNLSLAGHIVMIIGGLIILLGAIGPLA